MPPSLLLVSQQVRSVRSGVGTYARILLEALAARGVRCAIATWKSECDRDAFGTVRWIELGEKPRWDPTPGGFFTLGKRAAQALHARDGIDLVHFLDAREAHASRRTPGRTMVGTVHDDYAAHAPATPFGLIGRAADPVRRWAYYAWLQRLEQRTYRKLDALMANSTATAQTLTDHYAVAATDVQTVSLCVPPNAKVAAEALHGTPALLFAGGNWYRKGLDVLVRALPQIAERLPGVQVHVAGRDPAERRIRALAARTGVADRLTLHGQVDPARMPAMMAGATAFVMPSRREALGLVYLEAFRAGVPVISGRDGGVSDIVIDGENGLAVPTEDAAALAQAIITLVTDTELSKRLVAGGAQTLAERTAVRLIDETLRVYDEVTVSSSEASMHSAPPASASHAEPVASSRTPKKRRPIAFAENVRS
ncbi:MAG: hypothetical protein CMJ85_12660 [Planctomycetes bacterium]|nr:hypothetical protein [Planctomycetota bacterium]